jgi:hypothetical protein
MSKALATIVDDDSLLSFVKIDEFLAVVNQTPPSVFVKDHPMARGVRYLPIDKVEMMLTKMFQQWHVEILREGQMLNSIYTTVRLHYKHPITEEWTFQDGVGAAPIQTDKGESAANLAAIKSDAIMKALPAAESYAVKDAAEKIGKVFGRDLNRKDVLDFTPSYNTEDVKKQQAQLNIAKAKEKANASNSLEQVNRQASMDGNETGEDNGQRGKTSQTSLKGQGQNADRVLETASR